MGAENQGKAVTRRVWETPRVVAVERLPGVLGGCVSGSTVQGVPKATPCMLGGKAVGRCSIGTRVAAPFIP